MSNEPRSWRDVLPIHPAAELFPMMKGAEFDALVEDIREHGLITSCVLLEDRNGNVVLLDGRNRLDALELLGDDISLNDPVLFKREMAWFDDPYALAISLNIHRRHLTAEQRRELIARVIASTPERSDRQIAATVKASPTTVGTVRAEME